MLDAMKAMGMQGGEVLEHTLLSKAIRKAQEGIAKKQTSDRPAHAAVLTLLLTMRQVQHRAQRWLVNSQMRMLYFTGLQVRLGFGTLSDEADGRSQL